ncbi:MAG: branched-chain amino acid ABC transporter substrate-binding protein [Gemmatimonadetes bacterium]|nr:branched-chain amino acid ABC transporter substrate-binding protein [Gemmatimonadota bacterium]
MRKHILPSTVALIAILAISACREMPVEPPPPPPPPQPTPFQPGPLGAVTVEPGEAVQIRTLLSITVAPTLGAVARRGAEFAVEDMGTVHGRQIELGNPVDTSCSPAGGRAGALGITGDPRVAGIVGTNCSAAAVAASPIVSEAGMAMISPSNTSPRLTSDLAGTASPDYHAGYFRTASNDLHQARALSDFVYNELGLRSVATVHDGDPYTTALVEAFADAFADLGGEVPVQAGVAKGQTDMTDVLAEFAAAGPDAIFFPLFVTEGTAFAAQARSFAGLEEATLISAAALLVSAFLETPHSEGMYFAGPEADFGSNTNEVTGRSGDQVLQAFDNRYGGFPGSPYWAHSYDATTILLSAIGSVAVEVGDTMYIDRAGLRDAIGATRISGLVGSVSCDAFGDCGTGRMNIYHHPDTGVTDIAMLPVVYVYSP